MNDYEKLLEELEQITNRLDGMSVPDKDLDDKIYDATELLKQARETAAERS
jgi:exonuclease VII small subunit